MPQVQLPIFPESSTAITAELAFEQREGQVYYFNGHLPVFTHAVKDLASFRMFTSQIIANGSASQSQVSRAFGVPLITVKRSCKKLQVGGTAGFFAPVKPREGNTLNSERLQQAQALIDEGLSLPEVGARLGVLTNTLHKAVSHGRLKKKPARLALPSGRQTG
jgi:transposase